MILLKTSGFNKNMFMFMFMCLNFLCGSDTQINTNYFM